MQLKINDLKIGQEIFIFDKSPENLLIYSVRVNSITKITSKVYDLGDNIINIEACEMYNMVEECIDKIRTIDYIDNFDNVSFTWYLDYIKQAINDKVEVYVIREKKLTGCKEKYLDESIILNMSYDGKWKIKTKSKNHDIITTHYASSLGLRIFFNKQYALNKLI